MNQRKRTKLDFITSPSIKLKNYSTLNKIYNNMKKKKIKLKNMQEYERALE